MSEEIKRRPSKKASSLVVSLIGRPNVGKSSIFNRLMGKAHKAITFDTPGVTRDRHYGIANVDELGEEKPGVDFVLVDTGGFYPEKVETEKRVEKSGSDSPTDVFFNIMADHAKVAVEESDLILFVVDAREGILPFDETIAKFLWTTKKPFWVLVNKFDTEKQSGEEAEFYSLGVEEGQLFKLSAAHGLGFNDLKKRVHKFLLDNEKNNPLALNKGVSPSEKVVGRMAIIGAPNAGKSTLLNHLVGSERALVSEHAGTTVDPIEGYFNMYFGKGVEVFDENEKRLSNRQFADDFKRFLSGGDLSHLGDKEGFYKEEEQEEGDDEFIAAQQAVLDCEDQQELTPEVEFNLEELENESMNPSSENKEKISYWRSLKIIDTAGIRRKSVVKGFIESQSVFRALKCVNDADIVILLVDAMKGISHQDRRLCDIAIEKGKSLIICLNKMDLKHEQFKGQESDLLRKEWLEDQQDNIPWLNYVDIIPLSAINGKGVKKLLKTVKRTLLARNIKQPTGLINRTIFDLYDRNQIFVKGGRGKPFKIRYAAQVKTAPPTFMMFCNKSKNIPENYKRYLQKGIREAFELRNTPVHLLFKTGKDLNMKMHKVIQDNSTN